MTRIQIRRKRFTGPTANKIARAYELLKKLSHKKQNEDSVFIVDYTSKDDIFQHNPHF
jgi:hypothetical protein